jgi:hypothetical protein
MSQLSYQEKYLKYKNKYITLKTQELAEVRGSASSLIRQNIGHISHVSDKTVSDDNSSVQQGGGHGYILDGLFS